MELLVAAAWDPELARLRELVGEPAGAALEAVGVGLVEAAIGTSRALELARPARAVFIGTCGAFASSGIARGAVVVARAAALVDPAALEGRAALPPPMPREVIADAALADALAAAGARPARVACALGITTDDALAAALSSHGDVEHMEAFAFARACAAHGVPWTALLGVANTVGSRGRDEWRAAHVEASARAAELAHAALLRGERG